MIIYSMQINYNCLDIVINNAIKGKYKWEGNLISNCSKNVALLSKHSIILFFLNKIMLKYVTFYFNKCINLIEWIKS